MSKRKRVQQKGLGYQRKHHRPGKRYRHQRIQGAPSNLNPVHTFSGHPSYSTKAYAESKLLPSGVMIQEIITHPGHFIQSHLRSETVEAADNNISEETEIVDLTSETGQDIVRSTAESRLSHRSAEQLKDMIAYFFINIYHCPPEGEWGGKYGTVLDICSSLKLEGQAKRHLVKHVLRDVTDHIKKGETYSSKRLYLPWSNDKILLLPDSDEYQIIGNSMEDGHGLITTTEVVNEFRCVK